MSAYYAFEFSSSVSPKVIEDEVKKIVGIRYSVWVDEGKNVRFGKCDGTDWFCTIGYWGWRSVIMKKHFFAK